MPVLGSPVGEWLLYNAMFVKSTDDTCALLFRM